MVRIVLSGYSGGGGLSRLTHLVDVAGLAHTLAVAVAVAVACCRIITWTPSLSAAQLLAQSSTGT